jgi:hypothetical protein
MLTTRQRRRNRPVYAGRLESWLGCCTRSLPLAECISFAPFRSNCVASMHHCAPCAASALATPFR